MISSVIVLLMWRLMYIFDTLKEQGLLVWGEPWGLWSYMGDLWGVFGCHVALWWVSDLQATVQVDVLDCLWAEFAPGLGRTPLVNSGLMGGGFFHLDAQWFCYQFPVPLCVGDMATLLQCLVSRLPASSCS